MISSETAFTILLCSAAFCITVVTLHIPWWTWNDMHWKLSFDDEDEKHD